MAFINDDGTEALVSMALIFKKKWLLVIIDKMHDMKPMHYSAIRKLVPSITNSGFNEGLKDLVFLKLMNASKEDPLTDILSYALSSNGILLRPMIVVIKKVGIVSW